jgi:probable rRNA maturation factor
MPAVRQPDGDLQVVVAAPDGAVPAARGLRRWLSNASRGRARGTVTVAVISDGRMRSLNRTYRGLDYATDVLAFPVDDRHAANARRRPGLSPRPTRRDDRIPPAGATAFLGDIVIASGVAARQAREARHSVGTELRVLALHGLLHLLGYDHETDKGEMTRLEAELHRKGGLRAGVRAATPRGPARRRRRAR